MPDCLQISGVRADKAWKYSIGSPDISIAILDTGIEWQDEELRRKVRLNAASCPPRRTRRRRRNPEALHRSTTTPASVDDPTAGDDEADGILDASDLIAALLRRRATPTATATSTTSPAGTSSTTTTTRSTPRAAARPTGHGTGRATEAGAETNNGEAGRRPVPRVPDHADARVGHLRGRHNLFALGVVYAADNGAEVVEGAVGGLLNSNFARRAFTLRRPQGRGADARLERPQHAPTTTTRPTTTRRSTSAARCHDTAPNETCRGPGSARRRPTRPDPPPEFTEGCNEFLGLARRGPRVPERLVPAAQPPTTSFFRNSNLTQYGGKADIVLMGSTGSENTGQAAGAAGLLESYGARASPGAPLSGNEVRQLLTMTAEDVQPVNTGHDRRRRTRPRSAGTRTSATAGSTSPGRWRGSRRGRIPPEAQIDAPDWFAPINVDACRRAGVPITGRVAAPHGASGAWEVEYACGQDAPTPTSSPTPDAPGPAARPAAARELPKALLAALPTRCNGEVRRDAGPPAPARRSAARGRPIPYPDPDPERHAFQIRLVVSRARRRGEHRPLPQDAARLQRRRQPRRAGPGRSARARRRRATSPAPAARPRRGCVDLDGDNKLDVLQPTSSGEIPSCTPTAAPRRPSTAASRCGPIATRLERDHPAPGGRRATRTRRCAPRPSAT